MGWIGLRAVLLWPTLDVPLTLHNGFPHGRQVPVAAMPAAPGLAAMMARVVPVIKATQWTIAWPVPIPAMPVAPHLLLPATPETGSQPLGRLLAASAASVMRVASVATRPAAPVPVPTLPPFVVKSLASGGTGHRAPRWSGSAWAVARRGTGVANGIGGQLGGSQAGVRLVRALDRRGRIALAGRLTTPLGAGLREASFGVEWQPTRLPLRIVAQRRFAIGSGEAGPEIGLVGGFGPVALTHGLQAEGYGQAGVIRRAATEPYGDAAVRVTRTAAHLGQIRFDLGAGAWGGAQRGASRFDLGPTLAIALPIEKTVLRLTLDWRERVAGRASPGSGPALTLGTDF